MDETQKNIVNGVNIMRSHSQMQADTSDVVEKYHVLLSEYKPNESTSIDIKLKYVWFITFKLWQKIDTGSGLKCVICHLNLSKGSGRRPTTHFNRHHDRRCPACLFAERKEGVECAECNKLEKNIFYDVNAWKSQQQQQEQQRVALQQHQRLQQQMQQYHQQHQSSQNTQQQQQNMMMQTSQLYNHMHLGTDQHPNNMYSNLVHQFISHQESSSSAPGPSHQGPSSSQGPNNYYQWSISMSGYMSQQPPQPFGAPSSNISGQSRLGMMPTRQPPPFVAEAPAVPPGFSPRGTNASQNMTGQAPQRLYPAYGQTYSQINQMDWRQQQQGSQQNTQQQNPQQPPSSNQ